MGLVKKSILSLIAIPLFGYGIIDWQLIKRYPNLSLDQLPTRMKIRSSGAEKGNYIPYCDTFKARIEVSNNEKPKEIADILLLRSTLKNDFADKAMPRTIEDNSGWGWYSTFIHWKWKQLSLVKGFEILASYGYPCRLMSGGFHEFYIEKVDDKISQYDIYFASAHEYKNLGDDKVIPRWVNHLHLTYARFLFWTSLQPWKEI